jgi:hypothetical protein
MAIVDRQTLRRGIEIDLSGPEGNAFVLMGYASRFCKNDGRDPKPVLERMQAGDYEDLLRVFDEEFGDFVTLIR